MAFFEKLDDRLKQFISEQKVFFVATAPDEGRVNISPKGLDTLRILDSTRVVYLDLTGSGNETSAHLLARDRMTMMFCGFSKTPMILRLYGKGRVILPSDAEWDDFVDLFPVMSGTRQMIALDIESCQTSCGFSMPFLEFKSERDTLDKWAEKKGEQGLEMYWRKKNSRSIDGLPTHLDAARSAENGKKRG